HRHGPRGGPRLPRDPRDRARGARRSDPDRPHDVFGSDARDAGPLPRDAFAQPEPRECLARAFADARASGGRPPPDSTRRPRDRVVIQNPLGEDFSTLRSSMLPALLTIFRLNKHRELPQRVFEIADVVVAARNVRRVAGAAIHHKASFTEAKSLVLSLLRDVGWTAEVQAVDDRN